MGKKNRKKVILCTVLLAVCMLLGIYPYLPDPVSYVYSRSVVKDHIGEKYPDEEFVIDSFGYSFTYGCYSAYVVKEDSQDIHFRVYAGKWDKDIWRDEYEDDVASGINTALRLTKEYREVVRNVFPERTSPDGGYLYIHGDIPYGRRNEIAPKEELDAVINPYYSFVTDEAIPDHNYDVKTLGAVHGKLDMDYEDEDISYGKAADLILWAKDEMDKAGVGFYAVNLSLRVPPSGEHGEEMPSDATIYIVSFPYSEIYPEGLEERIEKAYKDLYVYWGESTTYSGEK